MRRYFSFLLLFVCFSAFAETKDVTFDFAANSWGITVTSNPNNKTSNIENLRQGELTLTTDNYVTGSGYRAVLYKGGGMPSNMLYCPTGAGFVINAAQGWGITKVVFTPFDGNAGFVTFSKNADVEDKGTISSMTWTATDKASDLSSVAFIASNVRLVKMVVTIETAQQTGGGSIGDDGEDINPKQTRLLIRQRTYGDVMGETNKTKCSAEKVYYYNRNLQLRRIINSKPQQDGNTFLTTDYMNYEYENNLLSEVSQWQYGVYNYGERGARKSNTGNITYKYDTEGRCYEENNDGLITRYTYDSEGRLVKRTEPSGKTITYDDFTADGRPLHSKVRPSVPQNLGDSYEEIYTYDAKGRLVSLLCQHDEDLKVEVGRFGSLIQYDEVEAGEFVREETWTYEGDFLKEKMTYEKDYTGMGVKVPGTKTVYSMVNGNPDIIRYYTLEYDPWGSGWSSSAPVEFEDEYKDFSDYKDMESQIVSAGQSTTEINTAELEYTAPQCAAKGLAVGMNVYRNGEYLTTVYLDDEKKTTDDTYIFADHGLKNNSYEYFVETITADRANLQAGYTQSYIVSNVATVKINTVLPAAYDLKSSYNVNDENVTVYFSMPAEASDYGFQSNSLMVDNGQVAESSTTDLNDKSLTCSLLNNGPHTVYIITRYDYGMVLSDPITINVATTPDIPTIITSASAGKTSELYDLAGRRLNKPSTGINIQVVDGKAMKSIVK